MRFRSSFLPIFAIIAIFTAISTGCDCEEGEEPTADVQTDEGDEVADTTDDATETSDDTDESDTAAPDDTEDDAEVVEPPTVPLDPDSPWPKFRQNPMQNGRSAVTPVDSGADPWG